MAEHYRTLSAVFPVVMRLRREHKQVLLARRANTGYMDGKWDFAGSGHVDENETAIHAVLREAREELGIEIREGDVSFAHLSHRLGKNGGRTYYDIYFVVTRYGGQPYIAEPEKCSDLEWFDVDHLPPDMIPVRRDVLRRYLSGEHYSEVIEEQFPMDRGHDAEERQTAALGSPPQNGGNGAGRPAMEEGRRIDNA